MDQYIWNTLFGTNIPYRPTYVPNTKLARSVPIFSPEAFSFKTTTIHYLTDNVCTSFVDKD